MHAHTFELIIIHAYKHTLLLLRNCTYCVQTFKSTHKRIIILLHALSHSCVRTLTNTQAHQLKRTQNCYRYSSIGGCVSNFLLLNSSLYILSE